MGSLGPTFFLCLVLTTFLVPGADADVDSSRDAAVRAADNRAQGLLRLHAASTSTSTTSVDEVTENTGARRISDDNYHDHDGDYGQIVDYYCDYCDEGFMPGRWSICPWMDENEGWPRATSITKTLHCMDGFYCNVEDEGYGCCDDHGNRARCWPSNPFMCEDTTCGGYVLMFLFLF